VSLEAETLDALKSARAAARMLALCTSASKNQALGALATMLREERGAILAANAGDLARARASGMAGAFVERLTLNDARIKAMARGVEEVAALPDPVGEVIARWRRPNGLEISQVRVPIGVIAIIYESRPNVTVDAGVLGLKAGNAVVLRTGSAALGTVTALVDRVLRPALEEHPYAATPNGDIVRLAVDLGVAASEHGKDDRATLLAQAMQSLAQARSERRTRSFNP